MSKRSHLCLSLSPNCSICAVPNVPQWKSDDIQINAWSWPHAFIKHLLKYIIFTHKHHTAGKPHWRTTQKLIWKNTPPCLFMSYTRYDTLEYVQKSQQWNIKRENNTNILIFLPIKTCIVSYYKPASSDWHYASSQPLGVSYVIFIKCGVRLFWNPASMYRLSKRSNASMPVEVCSIVQGHLWALCASVQLSTYSLNAYVADNEQTIISFSLLHLQQFQKTKNITLHSKHLNRCLKL